MKYCCFLNQTVIAIITFTQENIKDMRPDRLMAEKAGKKAETILGEQVFRCEPITGGMTNYNYRIYTNGGNYVFRMPGPASNILIDRQEERNALEQIRKLNLDVETIFFDSSSGNKITRFVADELQLLPEHTTRLIIGSRLLKKLHASGISFGHRFCAIEKIDFYESLITKYKIPLFKNYKIVKKYLELFNRYLDKISDEAPVPCHNDPVPGNILLSGSGNSFLIDWEYAGMNDYLWDLAAFSLENNLDNKSEASFLTFYFGHPVDTLREEKLRIYKIFQDILWALWASIKTFHGVDYSSYGLSRYERGLNNLMIENLYSKLLKTV